MSLGCCPSSDDKCGWFCLALIVLTQWNVGCCSQGSCAVCVCLAAWELHYPACRSVAYSMLTLITNTDAKNLRRKYSLPRIHGWAKFLRLLWRFVSSGSLAWSARIFEPVILVVKQYWIKSWLHRTRRRMLPLRLRGFHQGVFGLASRIKYTLVKTCAVEREGLIRIVFQRFEGRVGGVSNQAPSYPPSIWEYRENQQKWPRVACGPLENVYLWRLCLSPLDRFLRPFSEKEYSAKKSSFLILFPKKLEKID